MHEVDYCEDMDTLGGKTALVLRLSANPAPIAFSKESEMGFLKRFEI